MPDADDVLAKNKTEPGTIREEVDTSCRPS
jgi:hypothetical protein